MRLLVLLTFTDTLLAPRPEGATAVTELRSLGRISKPFVPKVQRARPVGRWREEHSCAPPALLLEQLEIVPRRQVRDIAQRGHKFVKNVGAERGYLEVERIDHARQIKFSRIAVHEARQCNCIVDKVVDLSAS